jgi:hypothetical protein
MALLSLPCNYLSVTCLNYGLLKVRAKPLNLCSETSMLNLVLLQGLSTCCSFILSIVHLSVVTSKEMALLTIKLLPLLHSLSYYFYSTDSIWNNLTGLLICPLHKNISYMRIGALLSYLLLYSSVFHKCLAYNRCLINMNDWWINGKANDWESGH